MKLFSQSARTFEQIEVKNALTLGKKQDYDSLLAYHGDQASRTPGWRVVPTPSKKYIIKTSSDNNDFIKKVIDRLESSRELYEKDFPPSTDFEHVSVVRVCGTEEEFHSYGKTGRGVGGWFSPQTTELVLYDNKNYDRNATYSVMAHEAFHQYCHFLFEEAEAHRWFDEGHGDYYGGVEFKRGRAKVTPHMPAGYDRLGRAREMVRTDEWTPLEEHLNFTHGEWQSRGIDSYCQSWSIVYYLRRGALGKVNKKVWKKEYADIIPNYVRTLYDGYQEAFAEILAEREEFAEAAEKELDEDDRHVTRRDIRPSQRDEIWEAAIDASWGQIDLEEFEANWSLYVKKYLD